MPNSRFFHPYPKYLQITDILRNRVVSQMQPGERLEPEVELGRQFGVSRETIRQALAPLEKEGLITRTRGRGSFVSEQIAGTAPRRGKLTGLAEDFLQGLSYRVLSKELVRADEETAIFLRVQRGAVLVRIDRTSFLEQKPLAYHEAYLPAEVGVRVMKEDMESASVAALLTGPCGYKLEEDHQIIEADVSDVRLSEHLQINIGAPVLIMRRIYLSENEKPIAYFKSYYRADRYVYTAVLRQDGKYKRQEGRYQHILPPRQSTDVAVTPQAQESGNDRRTTTKGMNGRDRGMKAQNLAPAREVGPT